MQIFVVNREDIKGRFDCYYYQPGFTSLEEKVKKITKKTLNDYILNIAGGSTPNKDESDKYYDDAGIPFLRVQNVTSEGLELTDVKYINEFTHNNLLKRSKVKEYDLITKITGVGRMAISAVAPKSFEGNINQHLVVIHTKDKQTSDTLAAYLNSDIGEKLASRRSTGGTRPALDYQALRTIPIVFKPQIVEIMQNAFQQKNRKEKEAEALLESIDEYVLLELGIQLPEIKKEMVYKINSNKIVHRRIDVEYYQNYFNNFIEQISNCKFHQKRLGEITEFIENGRTPPKEQYTESGKNAKPIIKVSTASKKIVDLSKVGYVKTEFVGGKIVKAGDIFILASAHQSGYVGKNVSYLDQQPLTNACYVGELIGIRTIQNLCLPIYLFGFLSTKLAYNLLNREKRGQTSHLYTNDIRKIYIPVPPMNIQQRIVSEIQNRRERAEHLQREIKESLQVAKKQVEKLLYLQS